MGNKDSHDVDVELVGNNALDIHEEVFTYLQTCGFHGIDTLIMWLCYV